MDITSKIKELEQSRQNLEDQVKELRAEIKSINLKIRKLNTISGHAEEVLSASRNTDDVPNDDVQIKYPTNVLLVPGIHVGTNESSNGQD